MSTLPLGFAAPVLLPSRSSPKGASRCGRAQPFKLNGPFTARRAVNGPFNLKGVRPRPGVVPVATALTSAPSNLDGAEVSAVATGTLKVPDTDVSKGKRFPGLRAARFQHPVDIRATRALKAVPALEPALRGLLGAAEAAMVLDGLASGVRVSESQLPRLHKAVADACSVLDMSPPELYVRQNPVPNAYTLAVQGRRPFIVVHSALLELLDDKEVAAVVGHELGHLKAEHGLWVSMANLLVLLGGTVFGDGPGRALVEAGNGLILRWQRAAELTCDRAALLVVQDPNIVVSALMKLAGGSPSYAAEMNVDEYLAQADEFDKASDSRLGRLLSRGMAQGLTHPFPVHRVRELKLWSTSNAYRTIVRHGKPACEDK